MKRSMIALVGCCLAFAAVVTVPAQPAQAVTLLTVTATSSSNSLWVKTADARCPANTEVYGGGARIVGGDQSVTFLRLEPYKAGAVSGYYAVAFETAPLGGGDYVGSWLLQVFARCGSGLSGVQHVSQFATMSDRSPSQYQITAQCPEGKVVIGTGFATSYISVPVHWIRPINNFTAVQAVIQEDLLNSTFATDPVTVGAFAVCASTPAGWWIEVNSTQPLQTNPQILPASCPAGKQVLGGGLTKYDGSLPGGYRMTSFVPDPQGAFFAVGGGSLFPHPPLAWALGSFAICADI